MWNAYELELWPEREVVSSTSSTTYELSDLRQVSLPIKSHFPHLLEENDGQTVLTSHLLCEDEIR